jgi:hypothetical protein
MSIGSQRFAHVTVYGVGNDLLAPDAETRVRRRGFVEERTAVTIPADSF